MVTRTAWAAWYQHVVLIHIDGGFLTMGDPQSHGFSIYASIVKLSNLDDLGVSPFRKPPFRLLWLMVLKTYQLFLHSSNDCGAPTPMEINALGLVGATTVGQYPKVSSVLPAICPSWSTSP